jgi:predicted ATP-binding protein involved in virulence
MTVMELFKRLELYKWRQFKRVDIDFDTDICVLTGPNGCGKTTILNVLGRHFGWDINFVSTPFQREKNQFWSDVWVEKDFERANQTIKVGDIYYSSGLSCNLMAPTTSAAQYSLQYRNQQPVVGIHIPS